MNKTKIETFDMTWNPVTGCLHNCEYCYARGIAKRFGGLTIRELIFKETKECHVLPYSLEKESESDFNLHPAPYPYGFDPTFHRYRLDEPQRVKKPQNIFVCSMADLFGNWVPDEWIKAVFEACKAAPWHRYIFLTKNPKRYLGNVSAYSIGKYVSAWFGASVTSQGELLEVENKPLHFISLEPLQTELNLEQYSLTDMQWIIVGSETGNRKSKIIPRREWIEKIVKYCNVNQIPLFMKDSLAEIWGKSLIRQFPWGDV